MLFVFRHLLSFFQNCVFSFIISGKCCLCACVHVRMCEYMCAFLWLPFPFHLLLLSFIWAERKRRGNKTHSQPLVANNSPHPNTHIHPVAQLYMWTHACIVQTNTWLDPVKRYDIRGNWRLTWAPTVIMCLHLRWEEMQGEKGKWKRNERRGLEVKKVFAAHLGWGSVERKRGLKVGK